VYREKFAGHKKRLLLVYIQWAPTVYTNRGENAMASLRKRKKIYYASYYVGGKEQRRSLETKSFQVAKERLRNLEASLARGTLDDDLPTRTPLSEIVGAYAAHIKNTTSKNSVTVDLWYLRSEYIFSNPA